MHCTQPISLRGETALLEVIKKLSESTKSDPSRGGCNILPWVLLHLHTDSCAFTQGASKRVRALGT